VTIKIIIAGGRNFDDYKQVCDAVKRSKFDVTEIVSGAAKGADTLGERYADENGIPKKLFPAEWNNLTAEGAVIEINNWGKKYNKLAGFSRNKDMGEYADALIAMDGGNGTSHMIKSMKGQDKPVFVYKESDYLKNDDYDYIF